MLTFPTIVINSLLMIQENKVYAEEQNITEKFSERISDFVLPIFGGEKSNDPDNRKEYANFAGELTGNLIRNGVELTDVVRQNGKDLLFKPTRSFWGILKDTYESVSNAQWSWASQGSGHMNLPTLAPGQTFTINPSDMGLDTINFHGYRVRITHANPTNARVWVAGANLELYPNYVARGSFPNGVRMIELYSANNSAIEFMPSRAVSLYNQHSTDSFSFGSVSAHATNQSYQVEKTYPRRTIDNSNRTQIFNDIDKNINYFFPGSLEAESDSGSGGSGGLVPIIYNINNSYFENTIVEGGTITYETLVQNNTTQNVITKSDEKFPEPEEPEDTGGTFPWDALLKLIGTVVTAISNLGSSIIDGISNLLNGLIDSLIGLFVPEEFDLSSKMGSMTDKFNTKFAFVFDTTSSFTSVFSSPKNISDIDIVIMDKKLTIFNQEMRPYLNIARNILTGFFCLLTLTTIYNRFVGKGDIIE